MFQSPLKHFKTTINDWLLCAFTGLMYYKTTCLKRNQIQIVYYNKTKTLFEINPINYKKSTMYKAFFMFCKYLKEFTFETQVPV